MPHFYFAQILELRNRLAHYEKDGRNPLAATAPTPSGYSGLGSSGLTGLTSYGLSGSSTLGGGLGTGLTGLGGGLTGSSGYGSSGLTGLTGLGSSLSPYSTYSSSLGSPYSLVRCGQHIFVMSAHFCYVMTHDLRLVLST